MSYPVLLVYCASASVRNIHYIAAVIITNYKYSITCHFLIDMLTLEREDKVVFKIWAKYVVAAFAALLAGVAAMMFFPPLDLNPAVLVSIVIPVVALAAVRAAYQAGRQSEAGTA